MVYIVFYNKLLKLVCTETKLIKINDFSELRYSAINHKSLLIVVLGSNFILVSQ